MLDRILIDAKNNKASDVHLSVDAKPIMRKVGELTPIEDFVLSNEDLNNIVKLMCDENQIEEFSKGNDLDLAYVMPDGTRTRVNIYRQNETPAIAIRILNDKIPTIDELGLPDVLKNLTKLSRGLILVTGPTGSGKSTTLAAMIQEINKNDACHILTLEDPIEYMHKSNKALVHQRQLGEDVKSFAAGLKSALREDPDIILVGEMRDYETIALALTAAETGHLVLSTLHTTSAASTIDRIIDVFPPNQQQQIRSQLASSLRAVIAQHLLPTSDNKSRVAALEICLNNDAISNMIRESKTYQINNVIQTKSSDGMQTLDLALAKLLQSGKISKQTALDNTSDKAQFERLISY